MLSIWTVCVCNALNSANQQVFVNFNSMHCREKRRNKKCAMSCTIYQKHWFGAFRAGMKWDLVPNIQWIFLFKTRTGTAKPFAKQKGMWIPFSLCMSKPGGTGEGVWELRSTWGSRSVQFSSVQFKHHLLHPWAQAFWFSPDWMSSPRSRGWDLWRGGVGCFVGSSLLVHSSWFISSVSRIFFSWFSYRIITPPEGEGGVQLDPPLLLLFLLLSNSLVGDPINPWVRNPDFWVAAVTGVWHTFDGVKEI